MSARYILVVLTFIALVGCGQSNNSVNSLPIIPVDEGDSSSSQSEDAWWEQGDYNSESNIRPECADSGNWVSLVEHDPLNENEEEQNSSSTSPPDTTNLEDCITEQNFDRSIKVRVFYCAHWRDMFTMVGSSMSLTTYTNTQTGYIGAFAGTHRGDFGATACKAFDGGKYDAKAHVEVERNTGVKRSFVWKQPAFAPLFLDLPDLDPLSPTAITDFRQLDGRADIEYTNVNNNFGDGHVTHLVKIYDRRYGPNVYGFEFTYQYNTIEEGFFEKTSSQSK